MKSYFEFFNYIEVELRVEMFYIDKGTGEPLIFVPGMTFSSEIFMHQIEYFSKNYRVIALDPRSQGRSTKVEFGNDYKTHGKDINTLIQKLGLDNITLAGWSTGNLAVWSYIEQFGTSKLKSVVTIDMPPKALSNNEDDWVESSFEDFCYTCLDLMVSQESQREFIGEYTKDVIFNGDISREELNMVIDLSNRTPFYITRNIYLSAMVCDVREGCKIAEESVPTLMFIAEHWSEKATRYMHKNYPKTQTAIFGGHMMFWQYADKFNAMLENFIKSVN